MLKGILRPEQEKILAAERSCLADFLSLLGKLHAASPDESTLKDSLQQLDEFFLLVIVGEFNSGKSAFINALLGEKILEEGVTPTTRRIHLLRHGEASREFKDPGLEVLFHPSSLLRHVDIVDTPGTNAIHRDHEALTEKFVPRSDLVLFVTSADRPFTESERAFLEKIRDWGKKIVVVINKTDILQGPSEMSQVVEFVRANAQALLTVEPEVFAISARKALEAKLDPSQPADRPFEDLEDLIRKRLDQEERVRLKLLNPLGVGLRLVDKYLESVEESLGLVQQDLSFIDTIESQQNAYQSDLNREFGYRLAEVDNVLHEFEKRGVEFMEDRIRLSQIVELLNKSKLRADYQRKVVGQMPRAIDQKVDGLIDWMVASELNQWQNLTRQLNRHRTPLSDQVIGDVGTQFHYDRNRLIETVGRRAQETLERYDRDTESSRLAEQVQMAVAGTALAEVGAIGLGTAVSLIATSTMADVTGILAAGAVAVLGLFVIPNRRAKAKRELRQKIASMRATLMDSLGTQFAHETQESLRRIESAFSPYTRFVRSEKERFDTFSSGLKDVQNRLRVLKAQLETGH